MPTRINRLCEGIMEAAWTVAVILVPVFFNVYSSRIFEPDKIAILRTLALIILGAWVVKLVDEGKVTLPDRVPGEPWYRSILRIPLLPQAILIVMVYTISTIFSVTPRASLWGSYQRLQGAYTTFSYLVIFAALLATLRRRQQIDRLITTLILTSLPVVLYGFLQRYRLDPIAWGGDTSVRIAANLGNSIFVAAYLIMVWPLTVGRAIEAFQAILKPEARMPLHILRALLYLLLALMQPVAMYFSFSRGPVLGLLASLAFLTLLLVMFLVSSKRLRLILVTGIILFGLSGVAGLLVLNIENGPLQGLRQSPLFGRFSLLLNPESNSALVRKYIWEGAANLVAPHDPISFPDGTTDKFNFLRPLIGYGPESMYVAFNPFYVPDLGRVEKRNASPDRSHNETWDSLVITGVIGFLVYTLLFISVFYYGMKWLGLAHSKTQKLLFWCATIGGGLAGSALLIAWGGAEWFGLGLPFGIAVGLVFIFLPLAAFTRYDLPDSPDAAARVLLLIFLLSAILAHYLEINFGIAIAVTRTYFWIYAALLLLVGYVLPKRGIFQREIVEASLFDAGKSTTEKVTVISKSPGSSRRRRAEKPITRGAAATMSPWMREAVVAGLLLTVLLSALGYDYISNQNRQTDGIAILSEALSVLPNYENARSYGVLGLVVITLLFGVLLYTAENPHVNRLRSWWQISGVTLGVGFAGSLFYWLWHAGSMAALARITPRTTEELIAQVNRIAGLLTNFYLYLLVLVVGLGWVLHRDSTGRQRNGKFGWASAIVVVFILAFLIVRTNLRIIHADITFKMAEPFTSGNTWGLASLLYQRAITLAPDEDYYYLFLGRSYLEQAKSLQDETEKAALVRSAEIDLKVAQKINPLNTDHTANLGRLFTWWAGQATKAAEQLERGMIANQYYERALLLSPNHSTLWGEWAILMMDVLNQPDEALTKLQTAVQLDEAYNFTQALLGDYYLMDASQAQKPEDKENAFSQAVAYYQKAVQFSVGRDSTGKYQHLLSLGNAYVQWGSVSAPPVAERYEAGIQAYLDAIKVQPNSSDVWRIHEQIARLYLQLSDKSNALSYANQSYEIAPEDHKGRLAELLQQIEQLP